MEYNISAYSIIKDHKVYLNESLYYSAEKNISFEEFIKAVYKNSGITYSPFYKMDNMSKLGFMAAELVIGKSKIPEKYPLEEVSMVFSNRSSSLDTDNNYFETIKDKRNYFPSPAVFVYTLPNIVMGEICIRNKIKGETAFFISEQFDPELMVNYVSNLIEVESAGCCIAGWVELYKENYECLLVVVEKGQTNKDELKFTVNNLKQLYNKI
ncbi:MAG: hypothetical protein ACK40G_14140 [Cytophagaceae bacterium]